MVLLVLTQHRGRLIAADDSLFKPLLVRHRPHTNGQLCDFPRALIQLPSYACHTEPFWACRLNAANKASVPWVHRHILFAGHATTQVVDNFPGIVIGHKRAPSRTDTLRPIQQHLWYYRRIPFWLNALSVILEIVKQWFIVRVEHETRDPWHSCEDVTSTGRILATHASRAKLSVRHEQIHIVTAAKVLRETDDRHGQSLIAMVIRRMLGHIALELMDLDFCLELALKTTKDHLPLSWLESIDNTGDGADIVCHRE